MYLASSRVYYNHAPSEMYVISQVESFCLIMQCSNAPKIKFNCLFTSKLDIIHHQFIIHHLVHHTSLGVLTVDTVISSTVTVTVTNYSDHWIHCHVCSSISQRPAQTLLLCLSPHPQTPDQMTHSEQSPCHWRHLQTVSSSGVTQDGDLSWV